MNVLWFIIMKCPLLNFLMPKNPQDQHSFHFAFQFAQHDTLHNFIYVTLGSQSSRHPQSCSIEDVLSTTYLT